MVAFDVARLGGVWSVSAWHGKARLVMAGFGEARKCPEWFI